MNIKALTSKLSKMKISYSVESNNNYNKDIKFSINGKTFKAGFSEGKEVIEDFCTESNYDDCTQETNRRYFDNFNQLLKYANRF